jgi:hypothetical protein
MGQITLRGLPVRMEREIRRRAKATGKSLNKVVLELVGASLDPGGRGGTSGGASLVGLAGGWSREEAREFEKAVRVFEAIDEEMWK